jgi:hypothetical protein
MSGTTPTQTAPPTDKVATIGPIVVSVVVLSIFLAAIIIAWWTKDSSLQILLGMAGTNAATAVGYWLGSSSGSKTKDATIAAQAVPQPGTTTTTVTPPTQGTTP